MKKITLCLLLFCIAIAAAHAQKQEGISKDEFTKVLSNPKKYPVLQLWYALEEREKFEKQKADNTAIERKANEEAEFEGKSHLLQKGLRFYIDRMDSNGYMAPWSKWSAEALHEYKNENTALKTSVQISADWKALGPTLGSTYRGIGRIDVIAVDKNNDDIMYAGSPSGGLWKTVNKGQTWNCLTNSIPKAIGVSCITIDYTSTPNTIYIATGDRDGSVTYTDFGGIYKSTDGGNSWAEIGNLTNSVERALQLIVHPVNRNNLFLLTTYNCFRSTDGGLSWTAINVDPDKQQFYSLAYNPSQPDLITLLAKIDFNNHQQLNVFTSNNFGANTSFVKSIGTPHHEVTDGYRITNAKLAIHPHAPNIYYVAFNRDIGNGDPIFGKLMVSYNNGISWSEKISSTYNAVTNTCTNNLLDDGAFNNLRSQSDYNFTLAIDPEIQANPADTFIYIGGINLVRSKNGGTAFTRFGDWIGVTTSTYLHADQHCTVFNSANELIEGNDGGVYVRKNKTDAGNFQFISQGLMVSQIYNAYVDKEDELKIWVALQDNGSGNLETIVSNGEKNILYQHRFAGDGLEIAKTDGRVYSMYVGSEFFSGTAIGNLFTSDNNPGKKLFSYCGNYNESVWNSSIGISPESGDKVVVGNTSLYYSENGGSNWKCSFDATSNFNNAGTTMVRKIVPSLINNKKIYAVMQIVGSGSYSPKSLKSRLLVSSDGGKTFSVATGPNPPAITSIAVGRDNGKEVVYGVCANYNAGQKVFIRKNNKDPWTNISANLPNVPINCIVFDTTSITNDVYVGTDAGVYYMSDNSAWVLFDTGMPVCLVSDLDIDYQNKKLLASTFGRGVWQCNLLSNQTVEIYSAGGPIICPNENMLLEVNGAPGTAYIWSAGSTTALQTINAAGVYTVTVTFANASTTSATIRISPSTAAFHSYWEKSIGNPNFNDEGVAIVCEENTAYYIGNTYPGAATPDLSVGAINDKGKVLWQKITGGPGDDLAGGICLLEPGELVLGAISTLSGMDVPGPNPISPATDMTWAFKINSSNGNFIKRANGTFFNFTYNQDKRNNKLAAVVKGPSSEVYFGGGYNNVLANRNQDYHLFKINGNNGTFTRLGAYGSRFNDFVADIAFDNIGNQKKLYATGIANYDTVEYNNTFANTFYSVKFGQPILFQSFLLTAPVNTFSNKAGWTFSLKIPGNTISANSVFVGENISNGACVTPTQDNKFCIAGHTLSQAFHMVTLPKFGGYDMYFRKQTGGGERHNWVMSGGGSGDDFASDILNTSDNSFVLTGTTYSNDNDFAGFNGMGNGDIFLMKITDAGVKSGTLLLGGNQLDESKALAWNADSSYFYVCGTTTKNNQKDIFIAKVTANTCPMPYENLDADPTLTTCNLTWNNRLCTNAYEVWYRLSETSVFSKLAVNGNTVNVTGLQSGSEYEWMVRSNCGNGNYSQFSPTQYFRTKSPKEGIALTTLVDFEASLYPNPSNGNFSIDINAVQDGIASITILDGTGRIVGERSLNVLEGANVFDYYESGLAQGIYFVRVAIGQQAKLIRVAVY